MLFDITPTWRGLPSPGGFAFFFLLLASFSWRNFTSLPLEGTVAPCGINTGPNEAFINPLVPRQLDKWSYVLCHTLCAVLSPIIILKGSKLTPFEVYRMAAILCFLLGLVSNSLSPWLFLLSLVFCHWDKMPSRRALKEERFILARGSSAGSLGPITFGPVTRQCIVAGHDRGGLFAAQ